jgi:opacity protein-like surface antigen
MKRFIAAMLILAAAVTAVSAKKITDTNLKIDIDVSEMTYDFGNIQAPKAVSHDFTIKNDSKSALVIISANASCGCTRPKFSAAPIQPGETGKVSVTFTPKGRSGEINEEVKLRVQSSDSKRSKRISLKLSGVVIPEK